MPKLHSSPFHDRGYPGQWQRLRASCKRCRSNTRPGALSSAWGAIANPDHTPPPREPWLPPRRPRTTPAGSQASSEPSSIEVIRAAPYSFPPEMPTFWAERYVTPCDAGRGLRTGDYNREAPISVGFLGSTGGSLCSTSDAGRPWFARSRSSPVSRPPPRHSLPDVGA